MKTSIVGTVIVALLSLQLGRLWNDLGAVQSSQSQRGQEVQAWRIDSVPLVTIGDQPNESLFQVIGGAFVGEELVLAERSSGTLRYYDRETGNLERVVGGKGEGPGEYQMLSFFKRMGAKIHTFDLANRRLTVLDRTGEVEKTAVIGPLGASFYNEVIDVFADGSLLVSSLSVPQGPVTSPIVQRDRLTLARFDADGRFLDSLGTHPGFEVHMEPYGRAGGATVPWSGPFKRRSMVGAVGNWFYIMENMNPVIPVFDQAGSVVHEIGSDTAIATRLSQTDRRAFRELEEIGDWEAPQHYPFYRRIKTHDTSVWVLHYGDDHTWTVYSDDGVLAGRVTSSEKLLILAVDVDIAAVLRRDDLNVETVELRRIVREWTSGGSRHLRNPERNDDVSEAGGGGGSFTEDGV